jgi:hypothetical protein
MASAVLGIGCWREWWRTWALPCVLVGVVIGIFPLIWYNLHAAPGQDSISVYNHMHTLFADQHLPLSDQYIGTFLIGLPLTTSVSPICTVESTTISTFTSAQRCTAIYSSWSAAFLLLSAVSLLLAGIAVWKLWKLHIPGNFAPWYEANRHELVKIITRLALLGNIALLLYFYANGASSAAAPATSDRYIIGILISFPVVLAPLCPIMSRLCEFRWLDMLRLAALGLISLLLIAGTLQTFEGIPTAQATNQQRTHLINDLEKLGVKHFYSEYWTCGTITFMAQDKLICAPITDSLNKDWNRYKAYWSLVHNDSKSSYIFPVSSGNTTQAEIYLQQQHIQYQHLIMDSYDVFLVS